jgi:hypothetical protein
VLPAWFAEPQMSRRAHDDSIQTGRSQAALLGGCDVPFFFSSPIFLLLRRVVQTREANGKPETAFLTFGPPELARRMYSIYYLPVDGRTACGMAYWSDKQIKKGRTPS